MKYDKFKKLLDSKQYEVEDFKYPNMPFTSSNHMIRDKKTGRRFLTVGFGEDEVGFIEVDE